jgi:choline dehydrogenase-like flavoprotein
VPGTIFGLENIEKRKEKYSLVTHDIVENADVCVIGSGAAGAIVACKLAEQGKSVVLLEKGGYYDSEDMNQREVDMIPLLWKNGGAIFSDNLRMVIVQGQCLGGTTVINDAVCFKTPPIIREQWRSMGVNIPEERWEAALDEVWKGIRVNKVRPEELNENNLMLKKACAIKGYKASENDRNSVDCMRCGFCHLGCHYETRQDMLVTYIHRALQNSDIKMYCNCAVERISYSGGVADGVEGDFIDSAGSTKFKIRVNAKTVVVSAGAIASSLLLMKNKIALGKAGRGLSFHPAVHLLGRFDQEINAYNGIPMAYTCHEFGVTNGVRDGSFLIESIFLPIFQFSMGLPSFLAEHAELMKDFTHYAMAGVLVKDEPNGTVTMTETGRAKIHHALSPNDIKTVARGLATLAELWFAAGANQVITEHGDITRLKSKDDIPKLVHAIETNPDAFNLASAHPQGGNRMGENIDQCVVDSNCKVHGFQNLFVCDASVFPTSNGVNPQITVMAIATMVSDHINSVWDTEFSGLGVKPALGQTCSIAQPMFCTAERLDTMFRQSENKLPVETLLNADENSPPGERWSFDKERLMIYNNKYWKGFFPMDQDFTLVRYLGGFWKRFYRQGNEIRGITHPFETNIDAPNIAELKTFEGFGELVHLKYTSPEFSIFYDLLKIVDKDVVLGKAFFGLPPFGNHILDFCMSRKYSVDFMTEDDHETIYRQYARSPAAGEVLGMWDGKLVSDSALTPVTQVFTYTQDNIGKLQMEYLFGGLLRGISRITLTPQQMNMYDFTNWHDEVKIVTSDFMVGKWCSPWTKIPLNFGPGFLSVETGPEGSRFCLRFTLRRI